MRLHAQTAMIENGFVYIPETAPWLAEYLHEMTVFPKGKHDDQVDSTAQFLDWFKTPMPGWAFFELARRQVQELEQRCKPQPVQAVWAIGSMEWLAEQEAAQKKESRTATPAATPLSLEATERHDRDNRTPRSGGPSGRRSPDLTSIFSGQFDLASS